MPIGQMRQTIFDDANLTLFQQAINDQFSQVSQIPFINGRLIKDQSVSSGANVIEHKLGKTMTGYFVTSKSANVSLWNGSFGDTNFILNSSGSAVVDLWVF